MSKRNANALFTRRTVLLSTAGLSLAGCSAKPYGVSLSDWETMFGSALGFEAGPAVNRQQAAQIPFATIGFRIGDSGEAVLILAEKSQIGSLWTSIKRQAILTASGRIRQTAGFRWNLSSTNFVEEDPVGTLRLITTAAGTFSRICDFADIHKFQVPLTASFRIEGEETITILETDIKTIRVVENCRCESLNWSFENYYWIDGTNGFVWRTIQSVHPNLEPFTVEILRPES